MSQADKHLTTPLPLSGDATPRPRARGGHVVTPFLPPGRQDIRVERPESDTSPPLAMMTVPEEDPLPPLPDENDAHGPRDILIGEAGAHFVLSRLLRWGIPAHAAGPGLPYDVIAEGGPGIGLIRLQVKSTARPPRGRRYRFALTRGFHGSARGVFAYRTGDFDIAAFVPLGLDRVLFRAFGAPAFAATPAEFRAEDAERQSLRAALAALMARRRRTPPASSVPAAPPRV